MINYYQELAIDSNADFLQIETALNNLQRKMIKRTNLPDLEKRTKAEQKLALIEEAKDILLDSNKRTLYDTELEKDQQNQTQAQAQANSQQVIDDIEIYIQHISALIEEKAYPTAIKVATEASQYYPTNDTVWFLLGLAYSYFGDEARALAYYEEAINHNFENINSYYNTAIIYLDRGEIRNAIKNFKMILQIDPNNESTLYQVTVQALNSNNLEEAYKYGLHLIEKYPTDRNKDLVADVYFQDALNSLPSDQSGDVWLYEEEKINRFIELTERAHEIMPKSRYENQLKEARKSLKKTYDWSKITLLTIPLFLASGGLEFLSIILTIIIIYFSIRPHWIINRRKNHGEKTKFDKISGVYTKTVGFTILLGISFVASLFGSAVNRDRYI